MAAQNPDSRPGSGSSISSAISGEQVTPQRHKVLLVEADPDLRAYLRNHLAPHYDVLETDRGELGLLMARTHLPDAIVSGILKGGDVEGCNLCRVLKSDPDTDFIPVILLTSTSDTASRIEGLADGADDCVPRSCDPAELLLRIRSRLPTTLFPRGPHNGAAPST